MDSDDDIKYCIDGNCGGIFDEKYSIIAPDGKRWLVNVVRAKGYFLLKKYKRAMK